MDDHDHTAAPPEDILSAASKELEDAESRDDEERLAALDSVHARLSAELDRPADTSSS
jgi:hypothetical protein